MRFITAAWCLLGVLAAMASGQGYSFTVLDSAEPDDPESFGIAATNISGNGRVVIGTSMRYVYSGQPWLERPYAWIRNDEGVWVRRNLPMLGRENVPPAVADLAGRPLTISDDGNVVSGMVGPMVYGIFNYRTAALWTNVAVGEPTVTRIFPIVEYGMRSYSCGMTSNGSSLLVFRQNGVDGDRSLWSVSQDGAQMLVSGGPDGLASAYLYNGNALSADGTVMAYVNTANGQPYRWTQANGSEQLPVDMSLPENQRKGVAWAVSPDGSTLGGWIGSSLAGGSIENPYPAIWNEHGLIRLPSTIRNMRAPQGVTNGTQALVTDMSHDATIIVGASNPSRPYADVGVVPASYSDRSAIWVNGFLRPLDYVLYQQGVDLRGVSIGWLVGVSDDGTTITGWGARLRAGTSTYERVAFVATILPPGTCDDIDFNRDGSRFDPMDIDAFLSVYSEGPCLPAGAQCRDIDFNNDGSLFDPRDIEAFLSVFSEGPCL